MARGKPRKTLLPAQPGLGDFWAIVHVKFPVPLPNKDDPTATPIQGYYQNFGVRAAPDRVQDVISGVITDGVIDWIETQWDLVDAGGLDREIRSRIEAVEGEGIWLGLVPTTLMILWVFLFARLWPIEA